MRFLPIAVLALALGCATGVGPEEDEGQVPPIISISIGGECEPGDEQSCDDCGVRRCDETGRWEESCSDLDAMCIVGQFCEAGTCHSPDADCTETCTGAAGEEICAGESGFAPCLDNGIRRCTCAGQDTFVDCEPICYH